MRKTEVEVLCPHCEDFTYVMIGRPEEGGEALFHVSKDGQSFCSVPERLLITCKTCFSEMHVNIHLAPVADVVGYTREREKGES